MKILLVKDHARKGKELFHVKSQGQYLCHFRGRPVQLKKMMMNKKVEKCGLANFCKSLQLCTLRTLRVLVGAETHVEYVYVYKRACKCRVWEFWAILYVKMGVLSGLPRTVLGCPHVPYLTTS